ncbi:MAG: TetR family transcriptional regulator [Anaerolineales bacterium]|nr:TetR family transcriptional regulator [Anaerolineales bacterium]
MNSKATRQYILEATITAIEKHGLQNLTTRAIAEEAGVNNAALHYYYGTKEQLLETALTQTLEHMLADTAEMLAGEGSIRERLYALFEYLVLGILRYPNLIRAHIQGPLMEGDQDSPFSRMIDNWLSRAYKELVADDASGQDVRFALYAAISACLLAGLMPEAARKKDRIDLRDEKMRKRFIDYLVESILRAASG